MSLTARLGRWTTRLSSATILALLLAGLPYGLATQIGWPLPRTLPTSLGDIEGILTTPVTDQVVINLLAVAVWVIWATFAASVIAEIPARVRGVRPRRMPVIAPIQNIAGWLMSGVTAGVIAAATISSVPIGPEAPPSAAVHATYHIPDPPGLVSISLAGSLAGNATAATRHSTAVNAEPPVICAGEHVLVIGDQRYAYTVQRDDSLWTIAELCLDDGSKWPQIWELNKHRHFPAIGGSLHNPDLIYPGWDLYLPPGAVPPLDADELGPDDAVPAPATPSPPPATRVPETSPAAPAGPTPTATLPPQASPEPTPTSTPAGAASNRQGVNEPGGDRDQDDRSLVEVALPVTAVLATAGLLAALLLARLRHRRGRRLQHRRHGRRLPDADPRMETAARVAAQPADVTRLDRGLRALAAALHGRQPTQLPDVVAVWLDTGTHHLLLAAPCPDPPAPYRAEGGDTIWALPADAALPNVDEQLAPLPALVTIASQPGGQHLAIDLERAGLLTITGDPDRRLDLLRYITAELATAEWADELEVVLVGFTPEQTAHLIALSEERVHAAASLPDALARVGRRTAANLAALADSDAQDAFAGRVNDIIADAWMPHLLLIADPAADLTELDTKLQNSRRCAVAVAAVSDHPTTWSVHVDHDGRLDLDWLSITDAHATRLPADELARLAPMLRTARTLLADSPTRPDGHDKVDDEPVPPAPMDEPWAEGTDMHGHLLPATDDPAFGASQPPVPDREVDEDPEVYEPATAADVPNELDPSQSSPVGHQSRPVGQLANDELEPGTNPAERSSAVTTTDRGEAGIAATGDAAPNGAIRLQPAFAGAQPGPPPAAPAPAQTSSRRRRAPADPDLDADLRDWHSPESHRPRVAILGPVTVNAPGQPPPDRLRFYSEIIVYLASRGARGAAADQLDDALWPQRPVTHSSRRVAMTKVRRWLGENADGQLWLLPNLGTDRLYRITNGYLLDWHLFRRLRTRGEARGAAGATDLRRALELVRGAPLDGADRPYATGKRNPYSWLPTSGIQPHHLASAIVDTAHQLVALYLEAGNTTSARWAVEQAWQADPDRLDDHPWLDLMRITAADGHTSELRTLLEQLIETRGVEVPEELSPDTYRQINQLAGELLRVE